MSGTRLGTFARARTVLETGVTSAAMPGAVAAILGREGPLAELVMGQAAVEPEHRAMGRETIFDLASLTKPITATALLVLLERGLVCLDDPVFRFLPAIGRDDKQLIRIYHLLTHTAGFRAWYPLYTEARACPEVIELIVRLPLAAEPGSRVEYSDLGYVLLGAVVETVAGQPLDRALGELVLAPLGMAETGFNPIPELRGRIAPTERDNAHESGMVRELGLRFEGWERGVAWGRVHDGNAAFALAGVSGHAGLFAPLEDVARFALAWLRRGEKVLSPRTVAAATRSWTDHLAPGPAQAERRGLGWAIYQPRPMELVAGHARSGGDLLSARAFGHTGFTGTSVWIDPELDLAVVLLANRVHPAANPDRFSRIRALFHNAVVAEVLRC